MGLEWVNDIVKKQGTGGIASIKSLLVNENSKTKADYMEKIYCKMNVNNSDLLMRLAWYISKSYLK